MFVHNYEFVKVPPKSGHKWAWLGSNQRPNGYEPRALPLSYRPSKVIEGTKY